jgi:hypothetical protein
MRRCHSQVSKPTASNSLAFRVRPCPLGMTSRGLNVVEAAHHHCSSEADANKRDYIVSTRGFAIETDLNFGETCYSLNQTVGSIPAEGKFGHCRS